MTVMLLGEDNPVSDEPEHALYNWPPNCAGWRLQRILGLDDDTYLGFARGNLCNPTWDLKKARMRAGLMLSNDFPHRVVVMLGAKVRSAFEHALQAKQKIAMFSSTEVKFVGCHPLGLAPMVLIALPHPSGRNTIWNDPQAKFRARALLIKAAPDVAWGSAPP